MVDLWADLPNILWHRVSTGFATLCYAIVLPGRKSAFRAGFWPECYRESTEIGPPAGRRGRTLVNLARGMPETVASALELTLRVIRRAPGSDLTLLGLRTGN